jgi:alkanesulfonate monooxygenase
MGVEFIGMIGHRLSSEIHPPEGPIVDVGYIDRLTRAHEAGGFDRILVGYFSNAPDGFLIGLRAALVTERIGLLLAHRPGFVAPTLAARKLATLDHLSNGRAAVHVISGGDDADQRRDGDHLDHDQRYARTDEYLEILRKLWTSDGPVDHAGSHYRFEQASTDLKPLQKPYLPIYFGGSSDAAIGVAGRHADVFALWGETQAQAKETIARVRASAARHGRAVRFSLSVRPVLAATEDEAWARARAILARTLEIRGAAMLGPPDTTPQNTGSRRLLEAARQGAVLDKRLWTEIAAVTGAKGNTTALVGTPQQVAEALLDYHDLGITTFLIRGFDPLEDAIQYGKELIPLVRAEVARREAGQAAA